MSHRMASVFSWFHETEPEDFIDEVAIVLNWTQELLERVPIP